MKHETAGDPMTGVKWTRKSTRRVAEELGKSGIVVSSTTVGQLLKKMDFSLKANQKRISAGSTPDRNAQFLQIGRVREQFVRDGNPSVSVDAKKKELIGQFKNPGRKWQREPVGTHDHDYASRGKGKGVTYGLYDDQMNLGTVVIGKSFDTPEFAVNCITSWWRLEGRKRYRGAKKLLILADAGGSNGYRCRAWKYFLQTKLCDPYGLSVTVAHYPPGASKWNPIEHRLFSEISKNWAGEPLVSYETMLKYARTTKTNGGLMVTAYFDRRKYEKGLEISDESMEELSLVPAKKLPEYNYTLHPRRRGRRSTR